MWRLICGTRSSATKSVKRNWKKIPYMLVVGENEVQSGSVSVRKRGQGDLGAQSLESVIAMIEEDIRSKQV